MKLQPFLFFVLYLKKISMEEKDFLNKMENLKKPEVNAGASQRQVKLALLNTKKSAAWGTWFLVVPAFFFCCVAIKYLFHWNWGIADNFIEWIARLDHQGGTRWISPVFFVLLPAIGAVTNLLAIIHFGYDRLSKELIVTIRIRWVNIILAIISIGVVTIIFLYALTENAMEKGIRKYGIENKAG
jgi:hypothetical protein